MKKLLMNSVAVVGLSISTMGHASELDDLEFFNQTTKHIALSSLILGMQSNYHFSTLDDQETFELLTCFMTEIRKVSHNEDHAIAWVEIAANSMAGYEWNYTPNARRMLNRDVMAPCTKVRF